MRRDAVGFAGSGHYSFLALLCCDLQLWFAEACSFISLSQSKYPPRWTTVIISPLTLRRSQARALVEYLPLEPCSPPLAGSACHVFCMVQSEQARCRPSRCAEMQQVSTCVFCLLVAASPRWNSELCAPLSESQWRAREGGKKGLQRWSNHNKICPSLQKMDLCLNPSLNSRSWSALLSASHEPKNNSSGNRCSAKDEGHRDT